MGVVFRATILSTPELNCTTLVDYIEQWVKTGTGSIAIGGVGLGIVSNCVTAIDSVDAPLCSGEPATPAQSPTAESDASGTDTDTIIIAIVVTVGGGVLVIVVCILAMHIFSRIKSRGKYTLRFVVFFVFVFVFVFFLFFFFVVVFFLFFCFFLVMRA